MILPVNACPRQSSYLPLEVQYWIHSLCAGYQNVRRFTFFSLDQM